LLRLPIVLSEFAGKWDAQSRRWVGGGLIDRRTVVSKA
jgi:hypothetical protein